MNQPTGAPPIFTIVVYIGILALLLFRMSRPQRISVTRMWFSPILLSLVGCFVIYEGQKLSPSPLIELILAIALGAALGIPAGLLRGAHTPVQATKEPGVMMLGSAFIPALIYMLAFGLRIGVRFIFPLGSPLGSAVGDGVLFFAIAFIAASYIAIYRKFTALEVASPLQQPS
ncbi:MAG TPA: hypothetical protein VMV73_01360 [Candidatus Dormibacteraeota bacterium]|nr:hypothetical protein [Candidatus Dormibacteraeota bacterium]